MTPMNGPHVVWYKRDLRVHDHLPLISAAMRGPVLPLYIAEPSVWQAADADARQWLFVAESLHDLRGALAALGAPLVVRVGEALDVFAALHAAGQLGALWAHEETGNDITYQRDRAVRRWARQHGVPFTEVPSNGVVRRLKSRDAWQRTWHKRMAGDPLPPPDALERVPGVDVGVIPSARDLGTPDEGTLSVQPGGERAAHETLRAFLTVRGASYQKAMSSPVTAFTQCSRISPHLAFGTLGQRQAMHALRQRAAEVAAMPPAAYTQLDGNWRAALRSFESRLAWRDHFVQKLEDEPAIEFHSFVRAFDTLRPFDDAAQQRYHAWAHGRTGYPMVDACMRALRASGYINFRMRALLVSFATYDLWLPWREPGLLLARLFTDYEPGIHWSQTQMQAASTGINTVRVYSPTKQARDHDPRGVFVRRWLPELAHVPDAYIHTPELMPPDVQRAARCAIGHDYPAPIVHHGQAAALAHARIDALRRDPAVRAAAERVLQRHGSRKQPRGQRSMPKAHAAGPQQLALGLGEEG